ncbi:MAG: hypothetical protein IKQ10_01485 [Oscillospiraceae bacterium]|nr:hypothetical protein [Oscillospiraceae bacterium]
MAGRKDRLEPEDDGRTIADMNVDGMPWFLPGQEDRPGEDGSDHYQMTPREQRMYTFAAVKAGLFIVGVFGAVFAAFIAFCDFIWFR